jgi:hypothetical protein
MRERKTQKDAESFFLTSVPSLSDKRIFFFNHHHHHHRHLYYLLLHTTKACGQLQTKLKKIAVVLSCLVTAGAATAIFSNKLLHLQLFESCAEEEEEDEEEEEEEENQLYASFIFISC